MRKRDWLRCRDPEAMLRQVRSSYFAPPDQPALGAELRSVCIRRHRLFVLTAGQAALNRVNHPVCHAAAEVGWRLAEGLARSEEIAETLAALEATWEEGLNAVSAHLEAPPEHWQLSRLVNVLALLLREPDEHLNETCAAARSLVVPASLTSPGRPVAILTPPETQDCCPLLRELFGDRGVNRQSLQWQDTWRTEIAVSLASRMYESRDFSDMPILADALQDAGCDSADVLDHCRGPGPHACGCWVVDLVLGKG